MSILNDFNSQEWTDFPGLDDLSEPEQNSRAQVVRNVAWERHFVETRPGVEEQLEIQPTLPAPGGLTVTGIRRILHWPTADFNRLLIFAQTTGGSMFVTHVNQTIGTREDLITSAVSSAYSGMVGAIYGGRVFFALITDAGRAVSAQGYVANGLFGGGVAQVEMLFQAPFTTVTFAETTPTSGTVTGGNHKIGLVYGTNNGHETKAHEIGTAVAVEGSNLVITVTPVLAWPAWVDYVKLIMTPVSNQSQYYFVPQAYGGLAGPSAGTFTPIQFTVDISDDLLSLGTDATNWLTLATSSTTGPARFIGKYGDRMVYITERADAGTLSIVTPILFSDVADPQRIALDRNERFLPSKLEAVAGFELYNTYYICGPSWTYAFNDTTGYPVEWSAPEAISESVGVKFPGCVSRTLSKAQAVQQRFVASLEGMYAFTGGSYSQLPMSYWQTETWARINWEAPAWCFEVVDHQAEQRVRFMVPLDDAVTPSHIMTWDYKKGTGRDNVRFSLDDYAHGNIGTVEIVTNPTSEKQEVWMGQADGNKIWREKNRHSDAAPFNDAGSGIDSVWRSMRLADVAPGPQRIAAIHLKLSGAGDCGLSVHGYQQDENVRGPYYRQLYTQARKHMLTLLRYGSETAYIEVSNDAVANSWWRIGWIKSYYKKWLAQR